MFEQLVKIANRAKVRTRSGQILVDLDFGVSARILAMRSRERNRAAPA
jgi:hypothetical protein